MTEAHDRMFNTTIEVLLQNVKDAGKALGRVTSDTDYHDKTWIQNDAISSLMMSTSAYEFTTLVRAGHVPKANSSTFGSLISMAAQHKRHDLIEPLIKAGCSITMRTVDDATPLELAIANLEGPAAVAPVMALIEQGAGITGSSALVRCAAHHGKVHLVEALIKQGRNPNEYCPVAKLNPLGVALFALEWEDYAPTVRLLLDRGASCDSNSDPAESTPEPKSLRAQRALEVLCEKRKMAEFPVQIDAVLDVLFEAGATLHPSHEDHLNPLGAALCAHSDLVAVALLERGADPNLAALPSDVKPFQWAALFGMVRTVKYMLTHFDEDPEQTADDGRPLADATLNREVKELLLAAAAERSISGAINCASAIDTVTPSTPGRAQTGPTL